MRNNGRKKTCYHNRGPFCRIFCQHKSIPYTSGEIWQCHTLVDEVRVNLTSLHQLEYFINKNVSSLLTDTSDTMNKLLVMTVLVAFLALSECILRPWNWISTYIKLLMSKFENIHIVFLAQFANLQPFWPFLFRCWKLPRAKASWGGAGDLEQGHRHCHVLLRQSRQHC